jgi:hypothetical protein
MAQQADINPQHAEMLESTTWWEAEWIRCAW